MSTTWERLKIAHSWLEAEFKFADDHLLLVAIVAALWFAVGLAIGIGL